MALWLARGEATIARDAEGVAMKAFTRALAWDHPNAEVLRAVREARVQFAELHLPRTRAFDRSTRWLDTVTAAR